MEGNVHCYGSMKNKAVFIDKDGTLIEDVPYNVDPSLVKLTDGVVCALSIMKNAGYKIIVVSNQSGVARGFFEEHKLDLIESRITDLLSNSGISLDGFFYCPHHPEGTVKEYAISCDCRKPKPGMIISAAKQFDIDLFNSWMIGDILHDVEAGNAAGCKTILLDNGNETEWKMNEFSTPTAVVKDFSEVVSIILKDPVYECSR
jgi:D-glycero-D-manno-heptose 1,7-bisphosphate phosphatase